MAPKKRLDSGLVIIANVGGNDVALLMRRSDAMETNECAVTCTGSKRPAEGEQCLTGMDFWFIPLIDSARAFFNNDFGHELGKALGRAKTVVDREEEQFHLRLFALRYDVPKEFWSDRVVPITSETPIHVRKGDGSDASLGPDAIFMDENGKKAVEQAFKLFARQPVHS